MKTHAAAGLALIAALALARTTPAEDKPATGTIKGTVKFVGDMAKANQTDKSETDAQACGHERPKPELKVDAATKGLADVVIYVKGPVKDATFTDAQKSVVSDQKSCAFEPHVMFVAEGGEVEFKNSDTVVHNVSWSSASNGTSNFAIGAGKSEKKKFAHADFITINCSYHPWMNGLLVVMASPFYAATDTKGAFELKGLPAGKYTVMVQHQTLGKAEKKGTEIEVKAGEAVTRDFELK